MLLNIYSGVLFDLPHILYFVISILLTIFILIYANKKITSDKSKDLFLKIWAVLTVLLHISPLWINFLKNGEALVVDNMLFPIYFCNLTMYLLVIVAFISDKKSKYFNYMAVMVAYSGIIGTIVTLFYPEFYLGASSILEWGVFKSFLSHNTMMLGSIYLFTGGFIKVKKENTLIFTLGLLVYGFIGLLINVIFKMANLYEPNAMYLQRPPIEEVPFLNVYVISIILVGVVHLVYIISNRKQLQEEMLYKQGVKKEKVFIN